MFPVACYPKSNTRGGAPTFVGPLDTLIAQGAVVQYAGSVRRLLSSYAGDSMRLQGNGAGTPIAAIPFTVLGDLDLTAAAAAAAAGGGTAAAGETLYDQTGTRDATQTVIAKQMVFSTAVEAKGGFGDGTSDTEVWLDLNLGTITQPSLFLFAANVTNSSSKILIGTSVTSANRYCRVNNFITGQNWGVLLAPASADVTAGKRSLAYLSNDTASKNFVDGTETKSGDADNTQLDMSGGRIGSALSATTNWLSSAGNSLSEVIIFGSDPTGLAGWADFVTAQKAYFGIA